MPWSSSCPAGYGTVPAAGGYGTVPPAAGDSGWRHCPVWLLWPRLGSADVNGSPKIVHRDVLAAMLEITESIGTEGVTEEEVERAKARGIASVFDADGGDRQRVQRRGRDHPGRHHPGHCHPSRWRQGQAHAQVRWHLCAHKMPRVFAGTDSHPRIARPFWSSGAPMILPLG